MRRRKRAGGNIPAERAWARRGAALGMLALGLSLMAAEAAPVPIDEEALAQVAVQEKGRKKPLTTLVRENLLMLSGSGDWEAAPPTGPAAEEEKRTAAQTLLGLWLRPQDWAGRPLILVDHSPLREQAGFERERKLFSYAEVAGNGELARLLEDLKRRTARDPEAELSNLEKELLAVEKRLELYERWASGKAMTVVPHPSSETGAWVALGQAGEAYGPARGGEAAALEQEMRKAWEAGDAEAFGAAVRELAATMRSWSPQVYPSRAMLEWERFYQVSHPFGWAASFFGAALLVLALTSGWKPALGYRAGWVLTGVGLALMMAGLALRVMISGRPPVTNMYETVIWMAFGTVLFGMVLEAVFRPRYFLMAATGVAVFALVLADAQPTVLDPAIHPLVPVLRHNTWLIVHVLTIVSSYAAFALALALAHIALFKLWGGARDAALAPLYQYVYRAMQIGILLLATGTVLGAVWANYSWGRFWDWDPKETWALVTLLCYLAVLHGRLAGWWAGFGLAVGAVVCFQAVLMAWYGVNFVLGKGLHSYGFGTGGFGFAAFFVLLEMAVVAVSLVVRYRQQRRGALPAESQAARPAESAQETAGAS